MRKHRGDLERAHEAEARDFGRRQAGDVLTVEGDTAARRLKKLGEQVEAGGLAGAVRTDQRMDGAARHAQGHAVHRHEAGELLGQILGFEDDVSTHRRYTSPRAETLQPQTSKHVQWTFGCREWGW